MATEHFDHYDRIVVDPEILVGKPVVKGTRIPVELVLKRLSQDLDLDLLFEAYPRLTLEDVKACLAYAEAQISGEEFYPTSPRFAQNIISRHMRFLLDESADYPLAFLLEAHGHDVTAIAREQPQSLKDHEVLAIAVEEQRMLITNDRDFGDLIFRRRLPHTGVILFRLHEEDLTTKTYWLDYVLTFHAQDLGDFIVVTDRGVRVRRLPRPI